MTINVNFVSVASAIAGITITGIPIKDLGSIPSNGLLLCPILIPKPDGFISNLQPVLPETYGTGGTERMSLKYDVTYRYLHAAIGANLDFGMYSGMITNIALILKTILANDVINGAIDFRVNTVSSIGPVLDPAGNAYHGCDFVFSVQQLCEV